MSELWSKFKGVFVQVDPNAVNQPRQAEQKAAPTASKETVAAAPPSVKSTYSAPMTGGAVNEKFTQALLLIIARDKSRGEF